MINNESSFLLHPKVDEEENAEHEKKDGLTVEDVEELGVKVSFFIP